MLMQGLPSATSSLLPVCPSPMPQMSHPGRHRHREYLLVSTFSTFKSCPTRPHSQDKALCTQALSVLLLNPSLGFQSPGMRTCKHHTHPPSSPLLHPPGAQRPTQHSTALLPTQSLGPPASHPHDSHAGDRCPSNIRVDKPAWQVRTRAGASVLVYTA